MLRRFLFSTTQEGTLFQELSMTALRVFFGLALAFGHGLGKVPVQDGFVSVVASMGLPFPVLFAWLAGLSELVGGILVAMGLFTRVGAAAVAGTMVVAAFIVHASDPFKEKELAFLYLFISLIFLCRGSGKFSIDRLIKA